MTKYNWDEIKQRAADAGYTTDPPKDGDYLFEVTHANFDEAKQRFGFRLKVVGGPENGKVCWLNQRIPDGTEKNPGGAAGAFLSALKALNVDLVDDPAEDAKAAIGNFIRGTVETNGNFQNIKALKKAAAPSAVPAPPVPEPASVGTSEAIGVDTDDPF